MTNFYLGVGIYDFSLSLNFARLNTCITYYINNHHSHIKTNINYNNCSKECCILAVFDVSLDILFSLSKLLDTMQVLPALTVVNALNVITRKCSGYVDIIYICF